jgi:hypothetical protein
MWLWESELRELGFRRGRASRGYWQCVRRFGLRGDEHLSAFPRGEVRVADRRGGGILIELTEFHVTFPVGENVHFYYHEVSEGQWRPEGHTSAAEIRRIGLDPIVLRDRADRVAEDFVSAIGGIYRGR